MHHVLPIIKVLTATRDGDQGLVRSGQGNLSLNHSANRPPVAEAGDRVADCYRQRGPSGPALRQETGTVLGGFAKVESIAAGFQWGLRFLSLMMLTLGVAVALLLWHAAKGLRAPPGAGYT